MDKRQFIINELMVSDFIETKSDCVSLLEEEETGKSKLDMKFNRKECLCISNVDNKHTDLYFFKDSSTLSMFKRVDHIIFEPVENAKWKIHLIEMKGNVGWAKWVDIRGKFRASYLLAQAIAKMLDMDVEEVIMYTTYEKVSFEPSETTPTARRGNVGKAGVKMEDEWNGINFGLNFGDRFPFKHIPITMIRINEEDNHSFLYGEYCLEQ